MSLNKHCCRHCLLLLTFVGKIAPLYIDTVYNIHTCKGIRTENNIKIKSHIK